MSDKTCITCGRCVSMERGLPNNEFWESRASRNVFCKVTGIMMATADCEPLCKGRFWIKKQDERTCHDTAQEARTFTCSVPEFCPRCGAKVVDDETL